MIHFIAPNQPDIVPKNMINKTNVYKKRLPPLLSELNQFSVSVQLELNIATLFLLTHPTLVNVVFESAHN